MKVEPVGVFSMPTDDNLEWWDPDSSISKLGDEDMPIQNVLGDYVSDVSPYRKDNNFTYVKNEVREMDLVFLGCSRVYDTYEDIDWAMVSQVR